MNFYKAVDELQKAYSELSISDSEARDPVIEELRQSISDLSFLNIEKHFEKRLPSLISQTKEAELLFPCLLLEDKVDLFDEHQRIAANYLRLQESDRCGCYGST
jgi:hypothetical protein